MKSAWRDHQREEERERKDPKVRSEIKLKLVISRLDSWRKVGKKRKTEINTETKCEFWHSRNFCLWNKFNICIWIDTYGFKSPHQVILCVYHGRGDPHNCESLHGREPANLVRLGPGMFQKPFWVNNLPFFVATCHFWIAFFRKCVHFFPPCLSFALSFLKSYTSRTQWSWIQKRLVCGAFRSQQLTRKHILYKHFQFTFTAKTSDSSAYTAEWCGSIRMHTV